MCSNCTVRRCTRTTSHLFTWMRRPFSRSPSRCSGLLPSTLWWASCWRVVSQRPNSSESVASASVPSTLLKRLAADSRLLTVAVTIYQPFLFSVLAQYKLIKRKHRWLDGREIKLIDCTTADKYWATAEHLQALILCAEVRISSFRPTSPKLNELFSHRWSSSHFFTSMRTPGAPIPPCALPLRLAHPSFDPSSIRPTTSICSYQSIAPLPLPDFRLSTPLVVLCRRVRQTSALLSTPPFPCMIRRERNLCPSHHSREASAGAGGVMALRLCRMRAESPWKRFWASTGGAVGKAGTPSSTLR